MNWLRKATNWSQNVFWKHIEIKKWCQYIQHNGIQPNDITSGIQHYEFSCLSNNTNVETSCGTTLEGEKWCKDTQNTYIQPNDTTNGTQHYNIAWKSSKANFIMSCSNILE
jgi:hypothetical protein